MVVQIHVNVNVHEVGVLRRGHCRLHCNSHVYETSEG